MPFPSNNVKVWDFREAFVPTPSVSTHPNDSKQDNQANKLTSFGFKVERRLKGIYSRDLLALFFKSSKLTSRWTALLSRVAKSQQIRATLGTAMWSRFRMYAGDHGYRRRFMKRFRLHKNKSTWRLKCHGRDDGSKCPFQLHRCGDDEREAGSTANPAFAAALGPQN